MLSAETDVGRARPNNEDAYLVTPIGARSDDFTSAPDGRYEAARNPVLLAISDGIGGGKTGEIASALVLKSLRRFLPPTSTDWGAALREAVERANGEVWTAAQRPDRRGMGATLTAVCVHDRDAHIAEVGDSRAYLLRNGNLRLLTRDQSYVQLLVDAGVIEQDEAERSPMKNVIVQAMGQGYGLRVELGGVRLEVSDTLLLCSDGLSNELAAEQLRDVLHHSRTPQAACRTLITLANEHGGRDNITVIVARLEA